MGKEVNPRVCVRASVGRSAARPATRPQKQKMKGKEKEGHGRSLLLFFISCVAVFEAFGCSFFQENVEDPTKKS